MEIEYNEDLDEYFVVLPDSIMRRLGWVEGQFIEYDIDDDMLKLYEVED